MVLSQLFSHKSIAEGGFLLLTAIMVEVLHAICLYGSGHVPGN